MRLAPLRELNERTIREIVEEYREFVGSETAFHIEYILAPGSFTNKDQEEEFFLGAPHNIPDDYATVLKQVDELSGKLAAVEIALMDSEKDKKWLMGAVTLLGIPYLLILILLMEIMPTYYCQPGSPCLGSLSAASNATWREVARCAILSELSESCI